MNSIVHALFACTREPIQVSTSSQQLLGCLTCNTGSGWGCCNQAFSVKAGQQTSMPHVHHSAVLCMCAGEQPGCLGRRPPSNDMCLLLILMACLQSRARFNPSALLCYVYRTALTARIQAPQLVKNDPVSSVHHAYSPVMKTQSDKLHLDQFLPKPGRASSRLPHRRAAARLPRCTAAARHQSVHDRIQAAAARGCRENATAAIR